MTIVANLAHQVCPRLAIAWVQFCVAADRRFWHSTFYPFFLPAKQLFQVLSCTIIGRQNFAIVFEGIQQGLIWNILRFRRWALFRGGSGRKNLAARQNYFCQGSTSWPTVCSALLLYIYCSAVLATSWKFLKWTLYAAAQFSVKFPCREL